MLWRKLCGKSYSNVPFVRNILSCQKQFSWHHSFYAYLVWIEHCRIIWHHSYGKQYKIVFTIVWSSFIGKCWTSRICFYMLFLILLNVIVCIQATKRFGLGGMKIHRRFLKEGKSTISLPEEKVSVYITIAIVALSIHNNEVLQLSTLIPTSSFLPLYVCVRLGCTPNQLSIIC